MESNEEGSSLVLVIFASLLAIAVSLSVLSATSLYLHRKRLLSLADGAALVGAESFDLDRVSVVDRVARPHLTSPQVRAAVNEFVASSTPADLGSVRIDDAGTRDGLSATVTISAAWRPPVVTFLMPEGIRVDVTSTSRSVFWNSQ